MKRRGFRSPLKEYIMCTQVACGAIHGLKFFLNTNGETWGHVSTLPFQGTLSPLGEIPTRKLLTGNHNPVTEEEQDITILAQFSLPRPAPHPHRP